MTFKRLLGVAMAVFAAAVLMGSVGAGAASTPAKHAVDVSTNAKVRDYLRSLGISPRGVVIQRGTKNYAGPRCPGKRWTCTRSHRVVQVASARGKNSFRCSVKRCVVVQLTKSLLAANSAKCIRTTGITQSCSITQTGTGPNTAIVVEIATKSSGLTQNASQTAQINQTATALDATDPLNTACVVQRATINGSTVRSGVPVTVTLDSHQSISITQNSHSGGNTVQKATDAGACTSGTQLEQSQTITSTARGSMDITQKQNAAPGGPNMLLNIQQNQADTYHGSASGVNTAAWSQTSKLTAFAVSPVGSVTQVQSTVDGGLEANVEQFSTTPSVIDSQQTETQCERVATEGTPSCGTPQAALPATYTWSQTQVGPVRKGPGSNQEGSDGHQFFVNQGSTQTAGEGDNADQSNVVEGACHTDGNCTVDQATTVQGVRTTNHQSGQDIDTTTTCTGTECVPTCTGEDCVAPEIIFDGSPGTAAPPATLGPYTMTRFGADPQPLNTGPVVTSVNDPAGTIGFSPALNHSRVGNGWATWSHGYTGDVYWTGAGSTITITLPSGTAAFYLYAEPNTRSPFNVTATAQDGTTSGPVVVDGNGGARYFGFYGIGGANLASITITTDDTAGLGVGEFGISPSAAPPIT
jgi:hypothetical protein